MSRHYVYVSGAKVDMYFGQLAMQRRKRVSAELGFNLAFIKGKISTDRASLADPIERLELVERVIREDNTVRQIGSTANWISDACNMACLTIAENRGLLFYIGETGDHIFALGGSASNILGTVASAEASLPKSHAPRLLRTLEQVMADARLERSGMTRQALRRKLNLGVTPFGSSTPWTKMLDDAFGLVGSEPKQNVQFLARVLHSERWSGTGRRYTLATPLYIALADA